MSSISKVPWKKIDEWHKPGGMPSEITALQNKIETETKLAMFYTVSMGSDHPAHIQYIVDLKMQLDGLVVKLLKES